jgi:hypothetical protein
MRSALYCCVLLTLAVVAVGCRHRGVDLPKAPVSGRVTYHGKPLGFGRIAFVHSSGQAAGGELADDGAFTLTAYQGPNSISVECYDYQRPGCKTGPSRTGNDKSLIPERYMSYGTSGLTFEVKPNDNKAEFTLKD